MLINIFSKVCRLSSTTHHHHLHVDCSILAWVRWLLTDSSKIDNNLIETLLFLELTQTSTVKKSIHRNIGAMLILANKLLLDVCPCSLNPASGME